MTTRLTRRRFLSAAAMTATGVLAAPYVARAAGTPIRLRYGHSQPIDHSTHLAAQAFVARVAELSGNTIEISLFPNNQLGVDRELQEMVQAGSIDFTHTNSATLAAFVPQINVMNYPFIWQSAEHYLRTVDGPFAGKINEVTTATSGHRFVAWWFDGFRNVFTRTHGVEKLADMSGLKIRSPQSPIFVETFKALGANPTPLAFPEIYSALEGGVIDGYEGSNGIIYASKLQEVSKFMVVTGHIMVGFGLVIAEKTFQKLPADARDIIMEAARGAQDLQRKTQLGLEDQLAQKFVGEAHLTRNAPDLAPFRAATRPLIERFAATDKPDELLKDIEAAA